MVLRFDAERMFKDMVDQVLIPSANHAIQSVCKYIERETPRQHLTQEESDSGSDRTIKKRTLTPVAVDPAVIDSMMNKITATCTSYGWTVLLSYGTGVYMDRNNPDLNDYINSNLWNPLRAKSTGAKITGRAKGIYYGPLGTRHSGGRRDGKTIAGWRTLSKGIKPTYAIQNAEKRLDQGLEEGGFVLRILEANLEKFFDTVDTSDYFDDGR